MNSQIVENIRQKFQKIRNMYKEQVGWCGKNILPIIGVQKPQKVQVKKVIDEKFRITDFVEMHKKKKAKTKNKHNKISHLSLSSVTRRPSPRARINLSPQMSKSSYRDIHNQTLESGIRSKLEDPFWK